MHQEILTQSSQHSIQARNICVDFKPVTVIYESDSASAIHL